MIWIGIDPGKSGALAVISEDSFGTMAWAIPFGQKSYAAELAKYIGLAEVKAVCVEKVNAMPGQGVVSMFNFGHNLGYIEGLLQAYELPYQLVPPQTWKKEFSLNSDKQRSIEVCQKLFPHVSLLPTEKSRKPNDGMAEALLMAEYARRKM